MSADIAIDDDPLLASEYMLAQLAARGEEFRAVMASAPRYARPAVKSVTLKNVSREEKARGFL